MGIVSRIAGTVAAVGGGLALYAAANARRAERLAPRDGRFVDVDGARLHYLDIGSGPAIVMIHGLGGQMRNFTYALTERLVRDFRVIVVDRPASGYSTLAKDAEQSLKGQARAIAGLIAKLGLDRPLVVGHSLGGAVSLALALHFPRSVGGLALLSPLTQPVDGIPKVFKALLLPSPVARHVVAWTLATPMGKLGRAKTQHVIFAPEAVVPDFDGRGGGALTLRPKGFFAASTEVSTGTDELVGMARRYPDLAVPLGILFGRGDRVLSPADQGEPTVAAVPGATLELIDGGHMIPLTQPDTCAAFIRTQAARIAGTA